VNSFFVWAPELADLAADIVFPASSPINLLFTDPQSATNYVSSYSDSQSETATGSVGFQGLVPTATVGGSLTIGQTQNYTVPPTKILNQSNIATWTPQWTFTPQSSTTNTVFEFNPTWLWYIPQDAYPSGGPDLGQEISFTNNPRLLANNTDVGSLDQTCNVPFPFSVWTIGPPLLTSLSPTSTTSNGGTFDIIGQNLYPGVVVAVLIGGITLPSNNVIATDGTGTTIQVTVPGNTFKPGTYPVVVNTEFNNQIRSSTPTLELTLTN
jgi:hypothetical protein